MGSLGVNVSPPLGAPGPLLCSPASPPREKVGQPRLTLPISKLFVFVRGAQPRTGHPSSCSQRERAGFAAAPPVASHVRSPHLDAGGARPPAVTSPHLARAAGGVASRHPAGREGRGVRGDLARFASSRAQLPTPSRPRPASPPQSAASRSPGRARRAWKGRRGAGSSARRVGASGLEEPAGPLPLREPRRVGKPLRGRAGAGPAPGAAAVSPAPAAPTGPSGERRGQMEAPRRPA